jgi:hypothetical protein
MNADDNKLTSAGGEAPRRPRSGNLAMDTTALGGLFCRAICTDTKTTHQRLN